MLDFVMLVAVVAAGLVGVGGQTHALPVDRSISDFIQRSWSVDEGLPHSTVRAIVQTTDGYVWFGTPEGVSRFDGVRSDGIDSTLFAPIRGAGVASLLATRDGASSSEPAGREFGATTKTIWCAWRPPCCPQRAAVWSKRRMAMFDQSGYGWIGQDQRRQGPHLHHGRWASNTVRARNLIKTVCCGSVLFAWFGHDARRTHQSCRWRARLGPLCRLPVCRCERQADSGLAWPTRAWPVFTMAF